MNALAKSRPGSSRMLVASGVWLVGLSLALGIFTAISFVVCVFYGLFVPPNLHMTPFLEMVLPAFKWLTFWSFCLGLIESFLYGVYVGPVFVPIDNLLARRWAALTGVQSRPA